MLAMPLAFAVMLAAAEFENVDLVRAAMCLDGGGDRGTGQVRRADAHLVAVRDHQHLVEVNRRALLSLKFLHAQHVADCYPVLLATCLDYRVHD